MLPASGKPSPYIDSVRPSKSRTVAPALPAAMRATAARMDLNVMKVSETDRLVAEDHATAIAAGEYTSRHDLVGRQVADAGVLVLVVVDPAPGLRTIVRAV